MPNLTNDVDEALGKQTMIQITLLEACNLSVHYIVASLGRRHVDGTPAIKGRMCLGA